MKKREHLFAFLTPISLMIRHIYGLKMIDISLIMIASIKCINGDPVFLSSDQLVF